MRRVRLTLTPSALARDEPIPLEDAVPKEPKFTSVYRTTWSSIKKQSDPKAIKACDFSKGLGPALEKLEMFLSPLYDVKPIPEKSLHTVETSVVDIQKTIKKYRDEIIAGNDKYPELGPSWRNLQTALRHVDEQLVDEVKELGAKATKLSGWLGKEAFSMPEVEGGTVEDVDFSELVEAVLNKLEPKKGDPEAVLKALGSKAMTACFGHSQALGDKVVRQATEAHGAYKFIQKKLEDDPPKVKLANETLELIEQGFEKIYALIGKDAAPLEKFLTKRVLKPIRDQLSEAKQDKD